MYSMTTLSPRRTAILTFIRARIAPIPFAGRA
jgi:hypothetical protein